MWLHARCFTDRIIASEKIHIYVVNVGYCENVRCVNNLISSSKSVWIHHTLSNIICDLTFTPLLKICPRRVYVEKFPQTQKQHNLWPTSNCTAIVSKPETTVMKPEKPHMRNSSPQRQTKKTELESSSAQNWRPQRCTKRSKNKARNAKQEKWSLKLPTCETQTCNASQKNETWSFLRTRLKLATPDKKKTSPKLPQHWT